MEEIEYIITGNDHNYIYGQKDTLGASLVNHMSNKSNVKTKDSSSL